MFYWLEVFQMSLGNLIPYPPPPPTKKNPWLGQLRYKTLILRTITLKTPWFSNIDKRLVPNFETPSPANFRRASVTKILFYNIGTKMNLILVACRLRLNRQCFNSAPSEDDLGALFSSKTWEKSSPTLSDLLRVTWTSSCLTVCQRPEALRLKISRLFNRSVLKLEMTFDAIAVWDGSSCQGTLDMGNCHWNKINATSLGLDTKDK